jgi:light-regulated signal transduction histidine kinase (bacteriophytochrome)
VIESSRPQLEAMGQTVDFQISVDVLLVNGDRERLFQVITNLLSNASKYSPSDSKIEIEVKEDKRWLTVEVRDRGPGVPDDDPEALFAMFAVLITRSLVGFQARELVSMYRSGLSTNTAVRSRLNRAMMAALLRGSASHWA